MRQLGLTVYKPEQAYHGYTIIAPMEGTNVYLLDMRGNVVHRWQMPYRPGEYGYLLENGNLLFGGRTGRGSIAIGGRSGIVMEVDWAGGVVWQYEEDTLHHDFCRLDNGNTMVVGWEQVPADLASKVAGGKPGTEPEMGLLSDYFREITPDGKIAWEWHAYEQLDPELDSICPLHRRDEWTHTNTCEILPDGNVMTSFRLLDTVGIIDKASGKFIWKWGREELGHPHDPTLLDSGNILIFDNGWHAITAPTPSSRIIEVAPESGEIQWEYKTKPGWDFFSAFISGAQRLPNGNTLICEGMTGRVFEVTHLGEMVWEYVNPFFGPDERFGNANRLFRAYRYGPDFPGLKGKTLTAEGYDWLNRLYGA